jgi:para-nitrobenzyl esterase
MNTYVLLASPLAKGLFQQAVIQSGISSATTPVSRAQNYRSDSEPGASSSSREVANRFLIADGLATDAVSAKKYQDAMSDQKLDSYLRGKNADDVLSIYSSDGPLGLIDVPTLVADGTVIPVRPLMEVYSNSADYNAVPLIIGSNRDEFKMLAMMDDALVTRKYGVLPRVKDKPYFDAYTSYLNDFIKANGVDEIAVILSRAQGDSVYAYRFDWDELPTVAGTDLAELFGAAHATEIPFVFGMFDDTFMNNVFFDDENTPGRDALSTSMSSYWAELAYSGSPGSGRNGIDPEWRPWRNEPADSDKYILFDDARDGGIRMSSEPITLSVLHQRLLTDTRFPNQEAHSQMYDCLLQDTPYWNAEEFSRLGGSECQNPMFSRL